MENFVTWAFDGIGVLIIEFIISFAFGGFCGYKYGMKIKNRQSQKAGKNSNQVQVGSISRDITITKK